MARVTRSHRRNVLAVAALAIVFAGSIAIATVLKPSGSGDGICSTSRNAPVTSVVVDASDELAPKSQAMLRETILSSVVGKRGARVIIARASGAREYRPEILFDKCDPGTGKEAEANEGPAARDALREEEFLGPLDVAIHRLATPVKDNEVSYLTETVMHVVADPAMHLSGSNATLVFMSDLIENTDTSRPYSGGAITLPLIREPFLSGILVRVIELPAMPGGAALQTYESRKRWRQWFVEAGSPSVQLVAPGLSKDPRGHAARN